MLWSARVWHGPKQRKGLRMAETESATHTPTTVNQQIADTLDLLNKQVTDNPGDVAASGLALSAAQSLALAVQDAVDHTRRMQMIAETMAVRAMESGSSEDRDAGQALVETALEQLKTVTDIAAAAVKTQS